MGVLLLMLTVGVKGSILMNGKAIIDPNYKWGWVYRKDVDDTWDVLFGNAKYINAWPGN